MHIQASIDLITSCPACAVTTQIVSGRRSLLWFSCFMLALIHAITVQIGEARCFERYRRQPEGAQQFLCVAGVGSAYNSDKTSSYIAG